MNKRPKSREETPKEGSDNAKALPHRTNMRPRCTKCKSFCLISSAKFKAPGETKKIRGLVIYYLNSIS